MIRKCVRIGKIGFIIGCLSFLNIFLFFNYGSMFNHSVLIPNCKIGDNSDDCEYNLLLAMLKIIRKLLTLRSLLPEGEYKKLWDIQVAISKLVSRVETQWKRKKQHRILEYSCAEIFNGTTFGYPYFIEGFVRTNCKRPSLLQSTSIIIENPIVEPHALYLILKYAIRTFRQVFLLTKIGFTERVNNVMSKLSTNKIQVIYTNKLNLGALLNKALAQVKSQFVIIAPHLGKLDNKTDIERLINIQEMTGAKIVASAVKNIKNGEWDRGCYQSAIQAYTLKYFPGYFISENECLYCTHVAGPFIAKTNFLRGFQFREFEAGVYRDLFLRLNEPKSIVSCPDVLFYIKPEKQDDNQLVQFANAWDITRIMEANQAVRWFGFRGGFNHTNKGGCKLKNTLIVPPDCRANILDVILFTLNLCEKNEIQCELQEGTLLGAVKFNNVLPWERDADITVLSAHFNKLSNLDNLFKEKGYTMRIVSEPTCCFEGVITGGILKIHAYGWTIEVYGQHKLTSADNSRTKVLMGNQWVYTPENPGLYVRNRYGKEIYKHAEHWLVSGKDTGWSIYNSGYFQKCEKEGHHGCLDQYKADGDLQFRSWL